MLLASVLGSTEPSASRDSLADCRPGTWPNTTAGAAWRQKTPLPFRALGFRSQGGERTCGRGCFASQRAFPHRDETDVSPLGSRPFVRAAL